MNRILLSLMVVVVFFAVSETLSAQSIRRITRPSNRSLTYSNFSYRSVGPGTHISRYAVPSQITRRNHTVSRSTHYRLPNTHSHRIYHSHPYLHSHGYLRSPYLTSPGWNYQFGYSPHYYRSGLSFRIGF